MRSIVLMAGLCLAAGCATLHPLQETSLPKGIPQSWNAAIAKGDLPVAAGLLEWVDEEAVSELVREALSNNPDLRATAKRLQAQGFLLGLTRSQTLPRVHGNLSKGRDLLDTGSFDSHRLGVGASWELDLWGRLADEHAAAKESFNAANQDWLGARDALAARVIQVWMEQEALRRSVAIESERVEVLRKAESLLRERYRDGTGNLDELSTARSRTEIARADLSGQQAALSEAVRRLELLAGRYPVGGLVTEARIPRVTLGVRSVPAETLEKRPDVRAALARVESARRAERSAKKAALPSARISGDLFRASARLGDLGSAVDQRSILGSLFQPLFEGGRIRSVSQARGSEVDAALLDLRSIVLRALKEVEDALDADRAFGVQAEALAMAVNESESSSRYYENRYRQGLDSLQSMLIAKEQEMAVKLRLNDVQGRIAVNRIDLALALGASVVSEEL